MTEPRRPWEDYTPASREENLAFARGMLARLSGVEPLSALAAGPCADCDRDVQARFDYHGLELCRGCASSRSRVAASLKRHAA